MDTIATIAPHFINIYCEDERAADPCGGSSESLGTLTLHKNYQRITRRRSTKTEKNRRDDRDVPPHSEFGLCGKNVRRECNGSRR
jgi:hypothetical protein